MTNHLTTTSILAEASRVLEDAGYQTASVSTGLFSRSLARIFEDHYGIVGVVAYDTWDALCSEWQDAQGALVDLMSEKLAAVEPKAWEGYLVLLTSASPPSGPAPKPHEIRLDTSRLRKFVATGEELKTLEDIRGALLPLLSLACTPGHDSEDDVLHLLPAVLAPEIEEGVTRRLVEAFRKNEPLLESLHSLEREQ